MLFAGALFLPRPRDKAIAAIIIIMTMITRPPSAYSVFLDAEVCDDVPVAVAGTDDVGLTVGVGSTVVVFAVGETVVVAGIVVVAAAGLFGCPYTSNVVVCSIGR